jgi:hypothetical protein
MAWILIEPIAFRRIPEALMAFPIALRPLRASAALFLTMTAINLWAEATPFRDAHLPGGGRISALARLAGNPPALLAGSYNGRLFRSTDAGGNWRPVVQGAGAEFRSILDLGGGIALAGAGLIFDGVIDCFTGTCGDPYAPGGIFRSRDGGLTWTQVWDGGATALSFHGGEVFAATRKGMLASRDSGRTWRKLVWASAVYGTAPTQNTRDLAWRGDSLILMKRAESPVAYWKGDTLRELATGTRPAPRFIFSAPPWLYSRESDAASGTILKRTRDGGATWETLSRIDPYLMAPGPHGMIAVVDSGIYGSADGRAWARIAPLTRDQAQVTEALAASGDTLFAGGFNDSGAAIHEPGSASWRMSAAGMHDWATEAVAYRNGILYAGDGQGGLLAFDPGMGAWSARAESVWIASQLLPWRGGLFAATNYGGASRLDPASGKWIRIAGIGTALAAGGDWFGVFDGRQYRLLACSGADGTLCETAAMEGFQQPPWFSPVSGSLLHPFRGFAISGDTVLVALDRMWISPDRGAHWSDAGEAPVQTAFLAAREGTFWLGGKDSLFRRDPGGDWRPVPLAGCRGNLSALAFRPGGGMILAGDSGVFYRKNGETTWADYGEGLSDRAVRSLAVDGNDLAVGLANGGVWTRALEPGTAIRGKPGAAAARYPGRYGAWRGPEGVWRRLDGRALTPAGGPRGSR